MIAVLIYTLAGITAGLLATLFGLGGGFVVIPTLFMLLLAQGINETLTMHIAIGTSLMIMLCNMLYATYLHHHHKRIPTLHFHRMLLFVISGALIGSMLGNILHGKILKFMYLIFMCYVIYKALKKEFHIGKTSTSLQPNRYITSLVSFITGLLGALLGIGGSTIIIPFSRQYDMPMINAVALANALAIPIAAIGSLVNILSGFNTPNLPAYSTGFVYWPAFFLIMMWSLVGGKIGIFISGILPDKISGKSYIVLLIFLLLIMAIK